MKNKNPYPLDSWSWEVVSSEHRQNLNSLLEEKPKILEDRLVSLYLINKCLGCTENPCLNYHNNQKPRRALVSLGRGRWNYSSKKCYKQNCKQEKCPYSHTYEESLYHPERFKKHMCKYEMKDGVCSFFDKLCPYLHEDTIQLEETREKFNVSTFKTEKCTILKQHDYNACINYHDNLKFPDRRRPLALFEYTDEYCENKKTCENGDNCSFCHTENEYIYHPQQFKTKPCVFKENCQDKESCHYYHPDANDRMHDKEKEIKSLFNKCEELKNKIQAAQMITALLEKFLCSHCREFQGVFVMKCGHSRCDSCVVVERCCLCDCETEVYAKMRFGV